MRRVWLCVLIALVVGISLHPARADFVYEDFNSGNIGTIQMRGSAFHGFGTLVRLTSNVNSQAGSAFRTSSESLVGLASFSNYFRFRITNGGGADGLVFVIGSANPVSNNLLGAAGDGIGYRGAVFNKSVGVEFDTWNNGSGPPFNDPSDNHVGINLNGSVASVKTQTEPISFNQNIDTVWHAWVDYNLQSDSLEVRWSLNSTKPVASQLSHTLDLASILGQNDMYFGFTSGTGGANGFHDLLHWRYTANAVQAVPEPGSLALLGFASLAGLSLRRCRRHSVSESAVLNE